MLGFYDELSSFDTKEYDNHAMFFDDDGAASVMEDSDLVISCSPRDFRREGTLNGNAKWFNEFSSTHFAFPASDYLCGDGVASMFGRVQLSTSLRMNILLLCPVNFGARKGLPQLRRDLRLWKLLHSQYQNQGDKSLDQGSWFGMHIDQLRDRVLSVIISRAMILLTLEKMAGQPSGMLLIFASYIYRGY